MQIIVIHVINRREYFNKTNIHIFPDRQKTEEMKLCIADNNQMEYKTMNYSNYTRLFSFDILAA